jgi:hypothetical protein
MAGRKFIGTSAWEQVIGQKKEMLDAFDAGKRKAKGHEVQTYHGRVAEAVFRKWLSDFLPKRFDVTAGYVVSQGQRGEAKYPHFDVIIYDQFDSPILWVEDNPDVSEGGKSRAVPVEHVRSILEVKSTFDPGEAKEAMEHLRDLEPFYAGIDLPQERYKKYLSPRFFCGVVFFNAKEKDQNSQVAINHLVPSSGPRNFFGGVILRGEGRSEADSGRIKIGIETKPDEIVLHGFMTWVPSAFSMFAFDLVALLNGTYVPGFLSSFHAVNLPADSI